MQLITALATPFKNGKIFMPDYIALLEKQRSANCELLCCGTTAECEMLTDREKKLLIKTARDLLPDVRLWVGVEGCTAKAASASKKAAELGADGIMISPPSFFKCTKEGFFLHASTIQKACDLPIMLYNAPSRCGYTVWQDTAERLLSDFGTQKNSLLGNLNGIEKSNLPRAALNFGENTGTTRQKLFFKDAGSDLSYARKLSEKLPLLCGNEEMLEEFVKVGAIGAVSVLSNIIPKETKRAMEIFKCRQGCLTEKESRLINDYKTLAKLAFCELNPVAIKYMLKKTGLFATCEMRLPLTAASEKTRLAIDNYFEKRESFENTEALC